jgi:hypothetical protein
VLLLPLLLVAHFVARVDAQEAAAGKYVWSTKTAVAIVQERSTWAQVLDSVIEYTSGCDAACPTSLQKSLGVCYAKKPCLTCVNLAAIDAAVAPVQIDVHDGAKSVSADKNAAGAPTENDLYTVYPTMLTSIRFSGVPLNEHAVVVSASVTLRDVEITPPLKVRVRAALPSLGDACVPLSGGGDGGGDGVGDANDTGETAENVNLDAPVLLSKAAKVGAEVRLDFTETSNDGVVKIKGPFLVSMLSSVTASGAWKVGGDFTIVLSRVQPADNTKRVDENAEMKITRSVELDVTYNCPGGVAVATAADGGSGGGGSTIGAEQCLAVIPFNFLPFIGMGFGAIALGVLIVLACKRRQKTRRLLATALERPDEFHQPTARFQATIKRNIRRASVSRSRADQSSEESDVSPDDDASDCGSVASYRSSDNERSQHTRDVGSITRSRLSIITYLACSIKLLLTLYSIMSPVVNQNSPCLCYRTLAHSFPSLCVKHSLTLC